MKKILKKVGKANTILFLLTVCVFLPYIHSIYYSLVSADDFSARPKPPYLINSIKSMISSWKGWGSASPIAIIFKLLNPLNWQPPESHLVGILLVIFFICYIFSLAFFIFSFMKCLLKAENNVLIFAVFLAIAFSMLQHQNYKEIFYWYVGSSYMRSECFTFFAIANMIRWFYSEGKKGRQYGAMVAFGMMACNSKTFCVAAGGTYFIMCLLYLKKNSLKLRTKYVIPMVLYLLTGCFTIFTPGNFARQGAIEGERLSVVKTAYYCVKVALEELRTYIGDGIWIFAIVSLICAGYILFRRFRFNTINPLVILGIGVLSYMGVLFPVIYGYKSPTIPNRIEFMLESVFIVAVCLSAFCIGVNVAASVEKAGGNIEVKPGQIPLIVLAGICMFYTMAVANGRIYESEYRAQLKNWRSVKVEREMWERVFEEIPRSDGDDVAVSIPEDAYIETGIIRGPGFKKDKNHWVNVAIADYYGKKTIDFQIVE